MWCLHKPPPIMALIYESRRWFMFCNIHLNEPKVHLTLDMFAVLGCWDQTSVILRAVCNEALQSGSTFRHIKTCLTQLQMFLLCEALSNESDSNRKAAPSTSDRNNKQKVNIRPSCTYDVLERMHVDSCFSRSVNRTDVDQSPSSDDVRHCYRHSAHDFTITAAACTKIISYLKDSSQN